MKVYLARPTGRSEDLKLCPWTFFLFYQYTALSSCAVDGHQMYSGRSVVGKASTVGMEILPTPPLIFTGVKRCKIWHRFRHHSRITQIWAAYDWKCSKMSELWNKFLVWAWSPYVPTKFGEVGACTPENLSVKVPHPIKFNFFLRQLHLIPYCIVQYASRSIAPRY